MDTDTPTPTPTPAPTSSPFGPLAISPFGPLATPTPTPTPTPTDPPVGASKPVSARSAPLAALPLPPEGEEVWTRWQCADYFGVSEFTWGKWQSEGRIAPQRYRAIGHGPHHVCYLASEVRALPGLTVNPYPNPPAGAEVLLREEVAAFFGIVDRTLKEWEADGRLALPRFRAPRGNQCRVCYLRSDAVALREKIRTAHLPFPHPDSAAFPDVYLLTIITGKGTMHALIDAADVALVCVGGGECWNISERLDEQEPRGTVILARDQRVLLKRVITGTQRLADAGHGGSATEGTSSIKPDHHTRISHRNDDFLDCRRSNLLVRSHAEVSYGCRKIRERNGQPTTSAYKGVSWMEPRGKWTAHIGKHGKAYYLGLFEAESDAAREYDNAARWLFGEYAKLNFPMERPALRVPTAGALSKPGAIERLAA